MLMISRVLIINDMLPTFVKKKIELDEIFILLSKQNHNELLQIESKRILEELREGKLFYECLQNSYYSNELIMLIKDGETFSSLVHNLENYSIYIEQSQKDTTKKMLFLIQPIFYGIFGVFIILLYASIFIPMFKMMDNI